MDQSLTDRQPKRSGKQAKDKSKFFRRYKMSELTIDTFGEIMDGFIRDNDIQMMIEMPKGTLDPKVKDNVGAGPVLHFYILLNAIPPICKQMVNDLGLVDCEQMIDEMLGIVKAEIMEELK